MDTSCLPEDVVYRILLWLPVVSLLRFKSVCKVWCSLIQTSDFITQHLHLSNSTDNNEVIGLAPEMLHVIHGGQLFTRRFLLLSGNNFQTTRSVDLPHHFQNEVFRYGNLVSCNGLICQVHRYRDSSITHDVSLWNPATKQFRILPKSAVPLPEWDPRLVNFHYGFGFDQKTNDYKVVRIIHDDYALDGYLHSQVRVEVYSLYMDSWRVLDVVLPAGFSFCSDPKTPFQNGIYCWLGWETLVENGVDIHRNSIISFDFTKEVFGFMPLPDVYSVGACYLNLALLWKKLACIDWLADPPESDYWHCKIWVFNEYGVKESWTKLYTVVLESFAYPHFLSMNGMIIWMKQEKAIRYETLSLHVCNPITQELMKLPFDVFSFHDLLHANYKESLVSIKSAHCAAARITGVVDV